MRVLAPAKINLHLRVGPARADGFHPLLTWMCTVGLFDILDLDRSPSSGVRLSCHKADLPCDENNLITRAVRSVFGAAGPQTGMEIRLQKRIPVGAGLGGGSSDAARTLCALNRMCNVGLQKEELLSAAATLG